VTYTVAWKALRAGSCSILEIITNFKNNYMLAGWTCVEVGVGLERVSERAVCVRLSNECFHNAV
jgi:hypothetical protein